MYNSNKFNDIDYKKAFLIDSIKREKALACALEIRKFEIELYWKRATYFWTFIGASFVAFIALQSSSIPQGDSKQELTIMIVCLGSVFSFAWSCVNKGSKFWQQNWEKHVDMLEDDIVGPLYKVVANSHLSKNESYATELLLLKSRPYSVSKINQLISYFVFLIWLLILIRIVIDSNLVSNPNWYCISFIIFSFLTCLSICLVCKSSIEFSDSNWIKRS
ncbi:hypothetical protein ACMGGR_21710 [Erwinia sp. BNK-24-b]|uniref:RipA family octameric membrane protein n=1 Tax=unclassified Erwinia TaxID=2622719 RepID=UPI0039BEF384